MPPRPIADDLVSGERRMEWMDGWMDRRVDELARWGEREGGGLDAVDRATRTRKECCLYVGRMLVGVQGAARYQSGEDVKDGVSTSRAKEDLYHLTLAMHRSPAE
ncbi:hypothetical protein PHSY_001349 [Pseudozyma hubeiensis SY62]|uniref:Uncharacterized protein n=1 Tax=Pseudozyma hubeiensis (strain SY62) TaxID=1305764 RepID=R9NYJ9_PSEHS|nr:hypothetical protein PHSY_001349 [Pseudozyma hubeiensis SY62]GAC93784.1 hypothetical protein PHSY_001349 [Pseudozyma hubeiensis SY62]